MDLKRKNERREMSSEAVTETAGDCVIQGAPADERPWSEPQEMHSAQIVRDKPAPMSQNVIFHLARSRKIPIKTVESSDNCASRILKAYDR